MLPVFSSSEINIAYFAGFFDGEGCITTIPSGSVILSVAQVNPKPLYGLQTLFGGSVLSEYRTPKHKQAWRWQITGFKTIDVLSRLLPYLIVKRDEAIYAITLQQLIPRKGKHDRHSKIDWSERNFWRDKIKFVKQQEWL